MELLISGEIISYYELVGGMSFLVCFIGALPVQDLQGLP